MTRYRNRIAAGLALAALVAGLIAALLWSLFAASAANPGTGSAARDIGALLAGNVLQAGLSTILSVVAGLAIAWALDRVAFPGRETFVTILSTGLVLPALVVAFGVVAVWGRSGWINEALAPFGLELPFTIFGLQGIIICHLILNGALAARVFYNRLAALSPRRLKLGRSLALPPFERFRVIDWPALQGVLPGLSAVIFLFCFTSFAIVLTLGGGPGNATFEVAIYESVRLDFDPGLAARLALIQLAVCLFVILPTAGWPLSAQNLARPSRSAEWADRGPARFAQVAVIAIAGFGFLLPLAAILAGALTPELFGILASPAFLAALATSLAIAAASATLAIGLALILALARANLALSGGGTVLRLAINAPAFAYLATPAVVLSLGFFLLARGAGITPSQAAPPVLILANALLALPLCAAIVGPPLERFSARTARLQRSLALGGLTRLREIELPLIRADLGYAAAVAFCLSLGDLGVIALFGTGDFATLPWLMYRAIGAYRSADAAVIAAVLFALTLVSFLLIPRIIGGRHAGA